MGKIADEFVTYNKNLYKELKQLKKGAKHISFKIALPFRIPVPNGEHFVFHLNENKEVMLSFTHKKSETQSDFYFKGYSCTWVEMTTEINAKKWSKIKPNTSARRGKTKKILSEIFDDLLANLNTFIEVIITKYQYHNMYSLALGDIQNVPIYIVFQDNGMADIEDEQLFFLRLNNKIENDQASTLNRYEINEIVNNYHVYCNHPANRYVLIMRKAERALFNNQFETAIIFAQVSLEAFIAEFVSGYYKIMKVKNADDIANVMKQEFKNVITQHFIPIVKKLSISNYKHIEKAFNDFLDNYISMRNKVVHEGQTYKLRETKEFFNIISDILRMVTDGMKNGETNDFTNYFIKFNVLNENINIERIIKKYE